MKTCECFGSFTLTLKFCNFVLWAVLWNQILHQNLLEISKPQTLCSVIVHKNKQTNSIVTKCVKQTRCLERMHSIILYCDHFHS